MSQQKTPVSEVIRSSESFIHRVIDIRRRAAELSEQAARLQEEAYLSAISELGVDDGAMAFGLACRGLGVDPTLRSGFVAVESAAAADLPASSQPVVAPESPAPVVAATGATARPSVAEPPAPIVEVRAARQTVVERPVAPAPRQVIPPVATHSTVAQDDPSRLLRYGVAIKRSKLSEAEEVIEQARRTAAQNRKANPYAEDRGRNAWRNTLFAAVLSQESADAETSEDAAEVADLGDHKIETAAPDLVGELDDPATYVRPALSSDAASPETVEADGDDEPSRASGTADVGDDDDVLDDAPPAAATAPQAPVMPSRAVSFTNNPVQSSPQSQRDPAPSAPPSFVRQTSFDRTAPASAPATPEVHVDRPVHNRTFAHGQAVPMPKSLKEALTKKVDDEKPATPTISPAPLRKAPSFIRR
ncbi:hypothetical protein HFN89_04725 [Rhizobium laguerreae]|nr:hypothetical protein [Rhizobium laguerreae]